MNAVFPSLLRINDDHRPTRTLALGVHIGRIPLMCAGSHPYPSSLFGHRVPCIFLHVSSSPSSYLFACAHEPGVEPAFVRCAMGTHVGHYCCRSCLCGVYTHWKCAYPLPHHLLFTPHPRRALTSCMHAVGCFRRCSLDVLCGAHDVCDSCNVLHYLRFHFLFL